MKQLFINKRATTLFFSEQASFKDVLEWIIQEVYFNKSNIFNLKEQHSCDAYEGHDDSEIIISGDEDRVVIDIEEVAIIDLNI